METITSYVNAVSTLSRIAQIRRFHIQEEYGDLLKNKTAIRINEEIKAEFGLDLLFLENDTEINDYEKKLEDKLNSTLGREASREFIKDESLLKDEIILLNRLKNVTVDNVQGRKINFSDSYKGLESIYKQLELTKPSIIALVKSLEYLQMYESKIPSYLATTRVTLKGKKIVVLFHLSSIVNTDNELSIINVFAFNGVNPRFSHPGRLFLQGLNRYGKNVTIGNSTKKLYLELTMPRQFKLSASNNYDPNETNQIIVDSLNFSISISVVETNPMHAYLEFVYAIDSKDIVDDIRNKTLL